MFSGHLEVLSLCDGRLTFLGANLSVFILPGICYTFSSIKFMSVFDSPNSQPSLKPLSGFSTISFNFSLRDPSLIGFSVHAVSNPLTPLKMFYFSVIGFQ